MTMTATRDTWTKIEDAQSHWIANLDADEYQKAYAEAMDVESYGTYEVPDQESDALSIEITVTVDGTEYPIEDYFEAHPNDQRFSVVETLDHARCERFGRWTIDASVPFRVLVRPYFTDYAVWQFEHVT